MSLTAFKVKPKEQTSTACETLPVQGHFVMSPSIFCPDGASLSFSLRALTTAVSSAFCLPSLSYQLLRMPQVP